MKDLFSIKNVVHKLLRDLTSYGLLSFRNCLVKHPQDEDPDEGVRELVDIVLRKMDLDNDSKLSFEDFSSSINKQSLLLEAFGQCLPSRKVSEGFLNSIGSI